MKKALHFGAGNIGRGFIGEILAKNGFAITFVDVSEEIIDALNEKGAYKIFLAGPEKEEQLITNVKGINNALEPEKVSAALVETDLVTTAIGPKILPKIAPLIASGIKQRKQAKMMRPLDVIACENMIGGSQFLRQEVYRYLDGPERAYADEYLGFPNAAVDRIVPKQDHTDPLSVTVEPFKEWVVDESQLKAPALKLTEVHYAKDLEPYIERKLFSVNTGHATVAYTGADLGYQTIKDAIKDPKVLQRLRAVLSETRALLLAKWDFSAKELEDYHQKIIARFENPYLSDEIVRVGRTPLRKLGYNERFIRPLRETFARGLNYQALLETTALIYRFDDPKDEESQKLASLLATRPLKTVISETTGLDPKKDHVLIEQLATCYLQHK